MTVSFVFVVRTSSPNSETVAGSGVPVTKTFSKGDGAAGSGTGGARSAAAMLARIASFQARRSICQIPRLISIRNTGPQSRPKPAMRRQGAGCAWPWTDGRPMADKGPLRRR